MKNDYEKYIIYGLLIFVLGGLIYSVMGLFNTSGNVVNLESKSSDEFTLKSISSGSTNQGDVLIELTPHKVDKRRLEVDISVNTHSVDLSQFDLKQITTLKYKDKSIKPSLVPSLNGHHSSGTLVFDVDEDIDIFTIIIVGIPNVEERIFSWR